MDQEASEVLQPGTFPREGKPLALAPLGLPQRIPSGVRSMFFPVWHSSSIPTAQRTTVLWGLALEASSGSLPLLFISGAAERWAETWRPQPGS